MSQLELHSNNSMAFNDPGSFSSPYKGMLPPLKSNVVQLTTFQLNLQHSQPIIHDKKANAANRQVLPFTQRDSLAPLVINNRKTKLIENSSLRNSYDNELVPKKDEVAKYQFKSPQVSPRMKESSSDQKNIVVLKQRQQEQSLAYILKETELKPLKARSRSVPRLQPLDNPPLLKKEPQNQAANLLTHKVPRRGSDRVSKLVPLFPLSKLSEPRERFLRPDKDIKTEWNSRNPSPREFLGPHALETLPHGTFFSMEPTPRKKESHDKSKYIQLAEVKEDQALTTRSSKPRTLNSKPTILDLILSKEKSSKDCELKEVVQAIPEMKTEESKQQVVFSEPKEICPEEKQDGADSLNRQVSHVSHEELVEAELIKPDVFEERMEESVKLTDQIRERVKKTEPPVHPLLIKIAYGRRSPYDPTIKARRKKKKSVESEEDTNEKVLPPALQDFRNKFSEVVKKLRVLKLTASEVKL